MAEEDQWSNLGAKESCIGSSIFPFSFIYEFMLHQLHAYGNGLSYPVLITNDLCSFLLGFIFVLYLQ